MRFADKLQDRGGTVSPVDGGLRGDPNDASRVQANLLVTIQTGNIRNQETIAHEGSHVADYQAFANSLRLPTLATPARALLVAKSIARGK